jgi:hypothetical protein
MTNDESGIKSSAMELSRLERPSARDRGRSRKIDSVRLSATLMHAKSSVTARPVPDTRETKPVEVSRILTIAMMNLYLRLLLLLVLQCARSLGIPSLPF